MPKLERSVVLLKPDALQRGLVGEIIDRFEQKGLKLMAMKMCILNRSLLEDWYVHHKDKPFFDDLASYMSSCPVVAMVWEGLECISTVRKLCGTTKGYEAEAGSIRGDYSISGSHNIIHASDSKDSYEKERDLIFEDREVFEYTKADYLWIYGADEVEE
jgi:nucleoside-diphosphate kinase